MSISESVSDASKLEEPVISQAASLAMIRIPAVAVDAKPASVTQRE